MTLTRKLIFQLIVGIGAAFASLASAQPFGVSMGTPRALLLVKDADVNPGLHELHRVPRPHSEFERYYVTIGHTSGVCAIRALGKDYENDATGDSVRAAFDTVKGQLGNSYGESRTDYHLRPDSKLGDPDQWLQSIADYERIHRAIWDAESRATMKNDVEAIVLIVQASGVLNQTYLFLEYRYSNYEACQNEIKNADANAL